MNNLAIGGFAGTASQLVMGGLFQAISTVPVEEPVEPEVRIVEREVYVFVDRKTKKKLDRVTIKPYTIMFRTHKIDKTSIIDVRLATYDITNRVEMKLRKNIRVDNYETVFLKSIITSESFEPNISSSNIQGKIIPYNEQKVKTVRFKSMGISSIVEKKQMESAYREVDV